MSGRVAVNDRRVDLLDYPGGAGGKAPVRAALEHGDTVVTVRHTEHLHLDVVLIRPELRQGVELLRPFGPDEQRDSAHSHCPGTAVKCSSAATSASRRYNRCSRAGRKRGGSPSVIDQVGTGNLRVRRHFFALPQLLLSIAPSIPTDSAAPPTLVVSCPGA